MSQDTIVFHECLVSKPELVPQNCPPVHSLVPDGTILVFFKVATPVLLWLLFL